MTVLDVDDRDRVVLLVFEMSLTGICPPFLGGRLRGAFEAFGDDPDGSPGPAALGDDPEQEWSSLISR